MMRAYSFVSLFQTAFLILIGLVATNAYAAKVTEKDATFVVDANTGEVLHAHKARQMRYPASLTKMMTLYIIFELIENRRLTYNAMITASAEAARRPPSKLGLRPGDRITVRQAVKALVVKSANDVAAAVGEHIAGSEPAFARLMTRKARELGMTQTVFRNASGLPHSQQVTTARDMAQLALRLRDHFPNHYYQFKTRTFRYKGRTFKNHNALLGRYDGVDGIKTGYTRASGFNLVTSARHGGRSIVAVVMGGRTSRARNATMRDLLSQHMSSGSTIVTRAPDVRVALHRAPTQVQGRDKPSDPNVAGSTLSQQATAQMGPPRPRLARRQTKHGARPPAADADISKPAGSNAAIQVGAFTTSSEANRQLATVQAKAGSLLQGARPITVRAMLGQREIYRARFAGYGSRKAALTCQKLKQLGIDCFVARSQ
ncbi:MAG: D-alanyl-D-alanine carboxypeptidase [Pseudomonadota bacterium]